MFEMAWELPVTFGPHVANWWMVGVTAASAITSGVLAYFAWRTSRDAKRIAENANSMQEQLHTDRIEVEYSVRMNTALAQLFRAIRAYYTPLMEWVDEAMGITFKGVEEARTYELLYPQQPSTEDIKAELEVARLMANADDARVLKALSGTLGSIFNVPPGHQRELLSETITVIRKWRGSSAPAEAAVGELLKIEHDAEGEALRAQRLGDVVGM